MSPGPARAVPARRGGASAAWGVRTATGARREDRLRQWNRRLVLLKRHNDSRRGRTVETVSEPSPFEFPARPGADHEGAGFAVALVVALRVEDPRLGVAPRLGGLGGDAGGPDDAEREAVTHIDHAHHRPSDDERADVGP